MFASYSTNGTGFEQKALWDWLDVLVFPVALAVGGFLYDRREKKRDQDREDKEQQREQFFAQERAQDIALQTYLDQMSVLMTQENLRKVATETPDSDIPKVAQARTLALLLELNPERKRRVLKLIAQLHLINRNECVVRLTNADLNDADLKEATLHDIDLSDADLRRANLTGADLKGTKLTKADLRKAILEEACLGEVDLAEADLRGANLSGADLSNAVNLTQEQVEKSLGDQTTMLPDKLEHPGSWVQSTNGQQSSK